MHTKDSDRSTATQEDAHRSDIALGQSVLDGRGKEAHTTSKHGGLHCSRHSILGVVTVVLVVVGHVDGGERLSCGSDVWIEDGILDPYCLSRPPSILALLLGAVLLMLTAFYIGTGTGASDRRRHRLAFMSLRSDRTTFASSRVFFLCFDFGFLWSLSFPSSYACFESVHILLQPPGHRFQALPPTGAQCGGLPHVSPPPSLHHTCDQPSTLCCTQCSIHGLSCHHLTSGIKEGGSESSYTVPSRTKHLMAFYCWGGGKSMQIHGVPSAHTDINGLK